MKYEIQADALNQKDQGVIVRCLYPIGGLVDFREFSPYIASKQWWDSFNEIGCPPAAKRGIRLMQLIWFRATETNQSYPWSRGGTVDDLASTVPIVA